MRGAGARSTARARLPENLVWGELCQGVPTGGLHILFHRQFLCSTWAARFFVPTHSIETPARAGAVKDGA